MKILQIHNYYQYAGGEDTVVRAERELLRSYGHEVIVYERDNTEIKEYSTPEKAQLLWKTSWSDKTFEEVSRLIKVHSPDVCHVHNFFPLISPSVYYACREQGIPVIQTLHNYRLICANGLFFRDGKICEDCLTGGTKHAVYHGCYRDSRAQTLAVVAMIEYHRFKETWFDYIDTYICLTRFAREKFIQAGFPQEKIIVKQNFLRSHTELPTVQEKFFLFVGRLDNYKGIRLLLDIAPEIAKHGYRITVIGDGPEKKFLENNPALEYLGKKSPEEVAAVMKKCTALIFPSLLYEGMPMTIIEAFACGKPVIASRLGGPAEMVEDGKTGFLFNPGDPQDLMEKLNRIISHEGELHQMSLNAYKEFETEYTAEINYNILLKIYQQAIVKSKVTRKYPNEIKQS